MNAASATTTAMAQGLALGLQVASALAGIRPVAASKMGAVAEVDYLADNSLESPQGCVKMSRLHPGTGC
jgi:hypothetical protein